MSGQKGSVLHRPEVIQFALSRAGLGLYHQDYTTGEIVWSPEARNVFRVASDFDVDAESFMALVHPDDRAPLIDAVAAIHSPESNRDELQAEYRIVRDEHVFWIRVCSRVERDAQGNVAREWGVVRDITPERASVEALATAQRRNEMGQLTGVLAHEFNNFLTSIMAEASLALRTEGTPPDVRAALVAIEAAGESTGVLTRQLLTYSRRHALDVRVMLVGDVLGSVERLLRRVTPAYLNLVISRPTEPLPVRVDLTQLQQLLLNLVVNACDASQAGQTITIDVVRPPSGPDVRHSARLVTIRVRDEGLGMTPEVLAQVFTPYFTTKRHGTGLGLPTCRAIAEELGGELTLASSVGGGTTALVHLPIVSAETWHETSVVSVRSAQPWGTRRNVLLAEDDPALRALLSRGLPAFGFDVRSVADGNEAKALVASEPTWSDVYLLDIVMPGIPVRELRRWLAEVSPRVPAVLMSGYPHRVSEEVTSLLGKADCYLSKPFSIVALGQRLREVLALAASTQGKHDE